MNVSVISLPPPPPCVPEQYQEIVRRSHLHHIALKGSLSFDNNCLISAVAVVLAAADMGVPALFQAGSLQWRTVAPDRDDGVSSTHYANMWDPSDPRSVPHFQDMCRHLVRADRDPAYCLPPGRSLLPEVHCWAALPPRSLVVDLTTGTFPAMAASIGVPWTASPPPQFFVGEPDGDTCVYAADPQATQLLFAFARLLLRSASPGTGRRFAQHVLETAAACRKAAAE